MAAGTSAERRRKTRKRALKKGMIVFKDRYCSTECMIRNESDDGALLMVSQNQIIPSHIEIRAYPNPQYRPAEVIWRTTEAMGIRYLDVMQAPQPMAYHAQQPQPVAGQPMPQQPVVMPAEQAPPVAVTEPAQPMHAAPPVAPRADSPAANVPDADLDDEHRPPVYVEPSDERPRGWDGFERRTGDRRRVKRPNS